MKDDGIERERVGGRGNVAESNCRQGHLKHKREDAMEEKTNILSFVNERRGNAREGEKMWPEPSKEKQGTSIQW